MTSLALSNSPEAVQSRLAQGRIAPFGPLLLLFARPALILLAQGVALLLFVRLNIPNAAVAVRNWWSVYGTLADFGCLGLLVWLTRREGIRLRHLVGFDKQKLKLDILIGLGIFLLVFPLTVFGGGMLANLLVYGSSNPALPEGAFIRHLPLLALLYSRLLWWPLWSFTEELTYNAYSLPRLKAMTHSSWLSVALVCFFWSLQHSFLPWIDLRLALHNFLAFVALTVALQLIYLRLRRLTPLVVGHWLMDLVSVLFMLQI
jgi:hypothetical protein